MNVGGISGVGAFSSEALEIKAFRENQQDTVSFADHLKNALNSVDNMQNYSEEAANALAAGKADNIDEVVVAGQKAEVALLLTIQVRNKILDAYNEIMRMQI
ncbi:flagellar hook-basal body complex protein FliE [Anaerobacterium chartisolvens]|uniref:Flagellar hook-basal body complex protein FliE n=1 Tax=Anaerobacterium chartisolvens TaxID=1297424 RepID=A0A369B1S3_9FIRM|nr:flagellar hook-basal body complex protein FliE [Anaerobacterium chartisolvens]RCX15509.1 flagellar hook-basal body complex protein FliE [Anaerobacterium chartisolvens]